MKTAAFTLLFIALFVPTTHAATADNYSTADTVIYHFGDSSVPPQYHRSYTITVTRNEAKLVVDSYGNVLSTATVALTGAQFRSILRTLTQARVRKTKKSRDNDGCTGGTSENIKVLRGSRSLLDAGVYHCGRKDYGDLAGDTTAVKNAMRAFFPEIAERLKS